MKERLPYYKVEPCGTYFKVVRVDHADEVRQVAIYKNLPAASSIAHRLNMEADEEF